MEQEKKPRREPDLVLGYRFDIEDEWHETVRRHYPDAYADGVHCWPPEFEHGDQDGLLVRFKASMKYVVPGADSTSVVSGKYCRSNVRDPFAWRLNRLPGD